MKQTTNRARKTGKSLTLFLVDEARAYERQTVTTRSEERLAVVVERWGAALSDPELTPRDWLILGRMSSGQTVTDLYRVATMIHQVGHGVRHEVMGLLHEALRVINGRHDPTGE